MYSSKWTQTEMWKNSLDHKYNKGQKILKILPVHPITAQSVTQHASTLHTEFPSSITSWGVTKTEESRWVKQWTFLPETCYHTLFVTKIYVHKWLYLHYVNEVLMSLTLYDMSNAVNINMMFSLIYPSGLKVIICELFVSLVHFECLTGWCITWPSCITEARRLKGAVCCVLKVSGLGILSRLAVCGKTRWKWVMPNKMKSKTSPRSMLTHLEDWADALALTGVSCSGNTAQCLFTTSWMSLYKCDVSQWGAVYTNKCFLWRVSPA